jgi:hypothetical protein
LLKTKGGQTLTVPPPTAFNDDEDGPQGGGRGAAAGYDPDAAGSLELPANLQLWH